MATILLIEDHDGTRQALTEFLEIEGYNCLPVADVYSARIKLHEIEQHQVHLDAVITDCQVPLGDGSHGFTIAPIALTEELRQLHATGTKIIVISCSKEVRQNTSNDLTKHQIPNQPVDKKPDQIIRAINSRAA